MGNQVSTGAIDLLANMLATTSVLLGAIGILIAILALPIFSFLRHRAEQVAKEAAEKELVGAMTRIEAEAISRVESMLPRLVSDYMDVVKGTVTDSAANEIAAAQSEEADEHSGGDQEGTE